MNILFGVFDDNEDFAILNHLILIAKYFIYKCKLNINKPTLRVFIEKTKLVYDIEKPIAKRNDRLQKHYKMGKNIASNILSINLKFSFFSMCLVLIP